MYTGPFHNELYAGKGTMSYLTGASYEGYFFNGKRHGYGKQINALGKVIYGEWVDGDFKRQIEEQEFEMFTFD